MGHMGPLKIKCVTQYQSISNSIDYVSNPSPELAASYPSQMVFAWFDSIIKKGWKNPITEEDLYDISPEYTCRSVMETWNKHWKSQVDDKKPKGKSLLILPTLILTFAAPFLEACINRVFSVLCQQVCELLHSCA